ncbi:uncharacterized protein [Montipora capricornis]|uniref:uncharacterized protein n=1 Tax=Montipora capricornis TaxID=246305 RepID=UPI0035F13E7F
MDEEHRAILRKNFPYLVRDLEPLKLLHDLAEVLDEDDRDEVKSGSSRKNQAETILELLPRKGPKAFECFVGALNKRQKHLARPLIEQSGIDISNFIKDDVGMSSKHRQILLDLSNAKVLHDMKVDDVVRRLHSMRLLDDHDKELLDDTGLASERVDMLLTDILPRKGPHAFKSFVQELHSVNPKIASNIAKDAGLTGSSADEKMPIQTTDNFELESLVQDVLSSRPEYLKQFAKLMDEKDVWGNGWERLYEELNLPAGMEEKLQGRDGGPTLNCIKGWISSQGRSATVKALLMAANRTDRKDCVLYLEDSLHCKLDEVDGDVNEVTRKMASLGKSSRENRTVEFFGDLNDKEANQIMAGLGKDSVEFLRKELIEAIGCDKSASTLTLIRQNKTYRIRQFTDLLTGDIRENTIKTLREVLSDYKGVTGPLLPPKKYVRDMTFSQRRILTTQLCDGSNSWMALAECLKMERYHIVYLDRSKNPAEETLRYWEVKAGSTVGKLYDILVELGFPYIADCL